MFQLNISLANENLGWFYSVSDVLEYRIKAADAVMAYSTNALRTGIHFACENSKRDTLLKALKGTFVDMYSHICKLEYISSRLSIAGLSDNANRLLWHTLVAFDRENEQALIENAFEIEEGITLDGIYRFKLRELRDRWNEICTLTKENSFFLVDEPTYFELLRFLISAVNPKVRSLTLRQEGNDYIVTGMSEENGLKLVLSKEELVYYLVDFAPLELVLYGEFSDAALKNQLQLLFDAKATKSEIYN